MRSDYHRSGEKFSQTKRPYPPNPIPAPFKPALLLAVLLIASATLKAETANSTYTKYTFGFGPFYSVNWFTSNAVSPTNHLRTRFGVVKMGGTYLGWPPYTLVRNSSNVSGGAYLYANGNFVVPDPFGTSRTIASINGSGQLIDTANGAVHATINNHQTICILANHICN